MAAWAQSDARDDCAHCDDLRIQVADMKVHEYMVVDGCTHTVADGRAWPEAPW